MKHGALAALLLISGCAALPRETPPTPTLSVFVVAHPDDWQLFMNPDAFHAMNEPHEKAVFVHVSAGDAGRGVGGEPTPYYLAREEGALRAIRFLANAADATAALGADTKPEAVERAGHKVARHTYANAVAYFLRLHDGKIVNGNDSQEHPQALERLRTGRVLGDQRHRRQRALCGMERFRRHARGRHRQRACARHRAEPAHRRAG